MRRPAHEPSERPVRPSIPPTRRWPPTVSTDTVVVDSRIELCQAPSSSIHATGDLGEVEHVEPRL
jgi:hypothetical protein